MGAAHPAGQVEVLWLGNIAGTRRRGQTLGTVYAGKARPGARDRETVAGA
jgi:hypothetical protein